MYVIKTYLYESLLISVHLCFIFIYVLGSSFFLMFVSNWPILA